MVTSSKIFKSLGILNEMIKKERRKFHERKMDS